MNAITAGTILLNAMYVSVTAALAIAYSVGEDRPTLTKDVAGAMVIPLWPAILALLIVAAVLKALVVGRHQ